MQSRKDLERQFSFSVDPERKLLKREQQDLLFRNTPTTKGGFQRLMDDLEYLNDIELEGRNQPVVLTEHEYQMSSSRIRRLLNGEEA